MLRIDFYKLVQCAEKMLLILDRSRAVETYRVLIENICLQAFLILNLPG